EVVVEKQVAVHLVQRRDGGAARRLTQQGHLAEELGRLEDRQRLLVAAQVHLRELHQALGHDVEGLALVALLEDRGAGLEDALADGRSGDVERTLGSPVEEGNLGQLLLDVAGALACHLTSKGKARAARPRSYRSE